MGSRVGLAVWGVAFASAISSQSVNAGAGDTAINCTESVNKKTNLETTTCTNAKGVVVEIRHQRNNSYEGEHKQFNDQGKLIHLTTYAHHKKNGLTQEYTKDGAVLINEVNYKDDEYEGVSRTYYTDTGSVRSEVNYKEGKVHGVSQEYWPNKKLKTAYTYEHGEKVGPFKRYFENGHLEEQMNYVYDPAQARDKYVLDGLHIRYYASGALREFETYLKGRQNGLSARFAENGQLLDESCWVNWKGQSSKALCPISAELSKILPKKYPRDQVLRHYSPEGILLAETYYGDKIESGFEHTYFSNGDLKSKRNYHFGKIHGVATEYFAPKAIKEKKNYKLGMLDGVNEFYFKSGAIQSRQVWKNGKKVKQTEFYENGKMSSEMTVNGTLTAFHDYDDTGEMQQSGTFITDVFIKDQDATYSSYQRKLEGQIKYYKDKHIVRTTTYRNGQKQGVDAFKNDKNYTIEIAYDNDVKKSLKAFSPEHKLVLHYEYFSDGSRKIRTDQKDPNVKDLLTN